MISILLTRMAAHTTHWPAGLSRGRARYLTGGIWREVFIAPDNYSEERAMSAGILFIELNASQTPELVSMCHIGL